jgi:uncharacterized membrane protein
MRYKLLFALIFILVLPIFTSGQEFYADISVDIDQAGIVVVEGNSNYPDMIGEFDTMTSKDKGVWTFSLKTDEVFSHAVFRINLPENSVVNYIRMPDFGRIEHSEDGISIIGTAESQALDIQIQYSYDKKAKTLLSNLFGNLFFNIILFVSILAIILMIYLLFFREHGKKVITYLEKDNDQGENEVKPIYNVDRSSLTDRQVKIVSYIEEKGGQVSQAELEKKLDMPKSSLSRNVDSLVRRDIIEKKNVGVSNRLFLKKSKE